MSACIKLFRPSPWYPDGDTLSDPGWDGRGAKYPNAAPAAVEEEDGIQQPLLSANIEGFGCILYEADIHYTLIYLYTLGNSC